MSSLKKVDATSRGRLDKRLTADVLIDPDKDRIRDLAVVSVHHHHVGVASLAGLGGAHQAHIALCGVDTLLEGCTGVEALLSARQDHLRIRRRVVAEEDEDRNLGELCDLLVRMELRLACARLHHHDSADALGVDDGRLEWRGAGLGVREQHGTLKLST